jgi:uncharacterized protein YlaI
MELTGTGERNLQGLAFVNGKSHLSPRSFTVAAMTPETPPFARAAWRSLHFSAKHKNYYRATYRCFSCSIRQAQKAEDRFQNGRTTHFGFETISEAQKEQKGELAFARGLVHTD